MEEKHREAIRRNFVSLVEQTDLEPVLHLLYEKGVFSEAMIEPYKDTSKDLRSRKRQLYMDIERRGPHAFQKLVDTLEETGQWNLVRALEPGNSLRLGHGSSRDDNFKSLPKVKREPVPIDKDDDSSALTPSIQNQPYNVDHKYHPEELKIHVIKSTKFHGMDTKIPLKTYITRTRKRGVLFMITNALFENNIEPMRKGAEVDQRNLTELFGQIGFLKPVCYNDLPEENFKNTIQQFTKLSALDDIECLFVIIASHGHERPGTADTDIRCSDGGLVPSQFIIEQFSNYNCPRLRNIPKVFIFQTCRGETMQNKIHEQQLRHKAEMDGHSASGRAFSDILIANSTIPGFNSFRDPEKGSWYIQAICEVFAKHAHECHVVDLFSLVDEHLAKNFSTQTSSVENWGFNKTLYLHPGLFED